MELIKQFSSPTELAAELLNTLIEKILVHEATKDADGNRTQEIETAFIDERVFECFVAEAVIQNLKAGAYVDPVDVRLHFKEAHFRDIVLEECKKHGIC